MKRFFLFGVAIINFIFSYSQENKIKTVIASADSIQRFSLYLPQSYNANKRYPLIIFLDPAARGNLPVSLYADLADKYKIVLAGSFGSRNFDNNSSVLALQSIYSELIPAYSIDTNNVFLAGFSGGARAASQLAIENNRYFHGVIACGAGFLNQRITGNIRIPYVGIVGNKDMNYSELLQVNKYLDSIQNDNILVVTQSGHDWPPIDYMELAFAWLLEQKTDTEILTRLKNKWIDSSAKKVVEYPGYATYFDIEQLERIKFFSSSMDSLLKLIPQNKNFTSDTRKYQRSLAEEDDYLNELVFLYTKAMRFDNIDSVKDDDWLDLTKRIYLMKKSKDEYTQLAGIRCLDKSFRLCVEYFMQLLGANQYIQAYNTAHIGSFFVPDNFNLYFFMAQAAAGLNEKKPARNNLKLAIQKGMNNKARAVSDPLLLKIFSKNEIESFFEK